MDNKSHTQLSVGWYYVSNPNGCTVEVGQWISNYISYIILDKLLIHAGIKFNPG